MTEKILIVDDDMDTLRLVGMLLERQGYQIIVADNGSHALDKAISESPDIILLDVMMPDIDGLEVARRLRANAGTAAIPILFFTAKTQVEDKVAGFDSGGDDYLTKPVHPAELSARVKALLARADKVAVSNEIEPVPRGKIIGVLSARGGVGVTSLALNLSIVLHHTTQDKVIFAELRPGMGTTGLELGFDNPAGLNNLLQRSSFQVRSSDLDSELVQHSSGIHLLLASNQPSDARFITEVDRFAEIVEQAATLSEYTILDLGPALPPITDKVLESCDQLFVVVEPETNVVVHTKALLEDISLKVLGRNRINVAVVNRVRADQKLSRIQIQELLSHPVPYIFTPVPEIAYQANRAKVPMVMLGEPGATPQQHNNIQQYTAMAEAIAKQGQKISV
jgi:DNA-binding response OmpR family regulator